MPPTLARLRRVLGLSSVAAWRSDRRWGGADGDQSLVVPLTVRTHTRDGADLRLLLEARFASATVPPDEIDRTACALIVPAATAWVRRQRLAAIEQLGRRLTEVEGVLGAQLRGLGAELCAIDVVAVEHLLASPSADPTDQADYLDAEDPA